ncbi:dihydrolipoyllysine-residue acetyltransferase [Saccharospirillum impatiens]|uniref:dihydrolipoyllysine-residue acetyltransferase n=1 Tax=Saccharospirillum impatiens TaxID=169438 RepID=UPI0004268469|nr:dihydrolipoyllysine-residue acetyltransferase [Saccharospirillum impatiens]
MKEDFILPDIGEGIVECELVEWLVEEGDIVVEDQPVADVQTDKALVQIPAKHAGRVLKRYVEQGEIAKVHAPLFALEIADDSPAPQAEPKPEKTGSSQASDSGQSGYEEDFILPDIGEGIVECELVEWLVEEGDTVAEDQPVADVQTDKALVQIPAKHAGRVVKRYVEQGEIAKVHSPLFRLALSDHEGHAPTAPAVAQPKAPEAVTQTRQHIGSTDENRRKVLATPAVRRIAREHDIELGQVPASGKNGRVLKEDMLRFMGELEDAPKQVKTDSGAAKPKAASQGDVEIIPVKGMRAAMARQMTHSAQTIPHFTYSEEIDVTELTRLRRSLNQRLESQGIKLTVMSLFIKSLSLALKRHPIVNSHMNDAGDEIHQFADHNIGMAVDSPMGLLVPNIKGVQNLSLLDLATDIKRLTEAGRAGRLSPDDLKGGTITVSNIGSIGGTVTTPIVNAPEVAIVGIGRLQRLPRPNDRDELEIRDIIQVSWSGDHRVLDGGTIARFCNDWKAMLEQPNDMVLWMV